MGRGRGLRACMAVSIVTVACGSQAADGTVVALDQGWSAQQKSQWYTLSQGSRLMPWAWMQVLEQADSESLFLDPAHVEKFRFLAAPWPRKSLLPLGFTLDRQSDLTYSEITKLRWKAKGQSSTEPWVGMNCAACHTTDISYQAKRFRIEGAPTLSDFQGFMASLNRSLAATRDDDTKWNRFASKVLAGADDATNRRLLKTEFSKLAKWEKQVERANHTDLAYGFARLDAFGHIFNKVLLRTADANQPTNPADAPVSYPFLWNIHQHDRVQWNAVTENTKIGPFEFGALSRNVGEVIGVFGDLTLQPPGNTIDGYASSARLGNLMTLERQLASLKPPAWPAAFPKIDAAKWAAGKVLFEKGPNACSSCHQVIESNDLTKPFTAQMTSLKSVGTDPWMACNAFTYRARSGKLEFTPQGLFVGAGQPYGETEPMARLMQTAVLGSIWYRRKELDDELRNAQIDSNTLSMIITKKFAGVPAAAAAPASADKQERLQRCLSAEHPLLAYKGRPLNGIWATAPYLHNGSVPTLFDLLLSPDARPASFGLGTREFDPQKVGFVTDKGRPDNSFVFNSRDVNEKIIDGNSNHGHDYGNALLSDDDRWALVEYMKAVGGKLAGNSVIP